MSDVFGKLNQQAQSTYIPQEQNELLKNLLFTRLGNVKEFVFASEDGESPCPAKYFMEILENYHFQFAEVSKMQKGDIWLADGDQFVIAKF
jgi:hypothetical protein